MKSLSTLLFVSSALCSALPVATATTARLPSELRLGAPSHSSRRHEPRRPEYKGRGRTTTHDYEERRLKYGERDHHPPLAHEHRPTPHAERRAREPYSLSMKKPKKLTDDVMGNNLPSLRSGPAEPHPHPHPHHHSRHYPPRPRKKGPKREDEHHPSPDADEILGEYGERGPHPSPLPKEEPDFFAPRRRDDQSVRLPLPEPTTPPRPANDKERDGTRRPEKAKPLPPRRESSDTEEEDDYLSEPVRGERLRGSQ